MSTTRREFFTNSAAGALGAGVAAGLGTCVALRGASAQETPKKLKIRVGDRTGSLSDAIGALAHAKKLSLEGIEIEAGDARDRLECCDVQLQKRFLAESEKTGVALASICMGLLNSYPVFSDPRAKSWLEGTIDATAALGAKVILVAFFGKGDLRPNQADRDKTIEIMKSVAERAEKKGVALGLENMLTAEQNMEMVDKIGSAGVRVYYDIGNSGVSAGYDVPKEIRMLGRKYICQIHFKDGGSLLGRGKLDMGAIGQALRDIGYEGWIILETASPLGPEASAAYNTGFIRGLLSA